MDNDLHPVERAIVTAWPPASWTDVTTVVAVSGGPDSVALLCALVRIVRQLGSAPKGRLAVAHFHHRIRPVEADQDALFVRNVSHELEVPFFQAEAARPARPGGEGLEAEARNQRYAFFQRLADKLGARYLVLGHTADDQAETILQRIIRGTGIGGLAGIPQFRHLSELTTIVRPLLAVPRDAIIAYLDSLQQPYRTDSSNAQLDLTRNQLRHQLLPQLAANYNPGVAEALRRLGRQAAEVMALIDQLIEPLWDQCVTCPNATLVHLAPAPLAERSPYLVRELLIRIWKNCRWPMRDMGDSQWRELADFILAPAGTTSLVLPGPVHVRRSDNEIQLQWGGGASIKSS